MYTHSSCEPKPRKNTNTFTVQGAVVTAKMTSGETFDFDIQDFEQVASHSWSKSKTGYPVANINKKVIKLSRFLLNPEDDKVVDHINGNPLDNRRCNLRLCSPKENARNSSVSKNSQTGVLGVSYAPKGRYRARIMVDRKGITLGYYDTLEEAVKSREKAEILYFGEYVPSLRGVTLIETGEENA
jgi:hypothetical protein